MQATTNLLARFPYPWASDWGEDETGLWFGIDIKGVRQGFRWIKPGTFLMGSPGDEPGRSGDETHEGTGRQYCRHQQGTRIRRPGPVVFFPGTIGKRGAVNEHD